MQTPAYRKTTPLTVETAREVCSQTKVDPTSLAVDGPEIISGVVGKDAIDGLTESLVRSSGAEPAAQLEGLLVATLGAKLASRLLDRKQAGDRWSTIVQVIQNGAGTTAVSGDDAIKLAKEIKSAAGAAFKERVTKDPTPEGIKDGIEASNGQLSYTCIATLVREAVAKKSVAVRAGGEQALQRYTISHELRSVFNRPGDTTFLRAIRPGDLINDEVLFLDAFEEFVHTNDAALKGIADSTQYALDALREGDDFTVRTNGQSLSDMAAKLKADVRRMVEWNNDLATVAAKDEKAAIFSKDADGISRAFDKVMAKLDAAAEDLHHVFAFNAHGTGYPNFSADLVDGLVPPQIAGPYEAFASICSKSKADVEIDTIETVEELIRVLHREVAHMFAEHVRSFAKQQLTLRKSHNYNNADDKRPKHDRKRSLNMTYIGSHTKESFNSTPMAVARDAVLDYVKHTHNGGYAIDDAVLTDKTLAFDTRLGAHRGRLAITYDSAHKLYFVEWGMQEPGTKLRIGYCKTLLEKEGYKHTVVGFKHTASRKVNPEDIEHELKYLLFTLDNLKNVDLSIGTLSPESLRKMFLSWHNHYHTTPTVDPNGTREQRIAQIAAQDPHLFNAAVARGYHANANSAVAQFYGKHFDHIGKIGSSAEDFQAHLTAIADHFYTDLQAKLREDLKITNREAEVRAPAEETAFFSALAKQLAACTTREAVRTVFAEHESVPILGPIYQST